MNHPQPGLDLDMRLEGTLLLVDGVAWLAARTDGDRDVDGPADFGMALHVEGEKVSVQVGTGTIKGLDVPLRRLTGSSRPVPWSPRLLDASGRVLSSTPSSQGARYWFRTRSEHAWVVLPYATSVRRMPWRLNARGVKVQPARKY